MYFLYLITLIAVATGVGFFSDSDATRNTIQESETSRIYITADQQAMIGRHLRSAYQMDPNKFPTPAAGQYASIDPKLISDMVNSDSGYRPIPQSSKFFIDADGNIFAYMTDERFSPLVKNGDAIRSTFSLPGKMEVFLRTQLGNSYDPSPFHTDPNPADTSLTLSGSVVQITRVDRTGPV